MQYKFLALAPVLAVIASSAFAAGPDENTQQPAADATAARCQTAGAQDLAFSAACAKMQKPLRVAVDRLPKVQARPANAKRITRMPWQIGVFQ
jgi:hypothetical protein